MRRGREGRPTLSGPSPLVSAGRTHPEAHYRIRARLVAHPPKKDFTDLSFNLVAASESCVQAFLWVHLELPTDEIGLPGPTLTRTVLNSAKLLCRRNFFSLSHPIPIFRHG